MGTEDAEEDEVMLQGEASIQVGSTSDSCRTSESEVCHVEPYYRLRVGGRVETDARGR